MHAFDSDISAISLDPGRLKARVSPSWGINGNPNGGYLMALLANAMLQGKETYEAHLITANFVARSEPGDAELLVERMAESGKFDRFQCRMIQGEQERIRAFGTFAKASGESLSKRYERSQPDFAPVEQCVAIPEIPNYSLYSEMEVRLDPACAGWMTGAVSNESLMKGWIRFRDSRPPDLFATLLMIDSFPPAVLASRGLVAWVPTIEFSVNVLQIPDCEWLKGCFKTNYIHNGLLEEDGEMWDERGELVAISRQIAQIRTPN